MGFEQVPQGGQSVLRFAKARQRASRVGSKRRAGCAVGSGRLGERGRGYGKRRHQARLSSSVAPVTPSGEGRSGRVDGGLRDGALDHGPRFGLARSGGARARSRRARAGDPGREAAGRPEATDDGGAARRRGPE
ncbi:hypothetical protein Ddc_18812 [Ditylenchus destructor]|nr:hypothetical protein Ddc_18812 [Ditylenchus destructor]